MRFRLRRNSSNRNAALLALATFLRYAFALAILFGSTSGIAKENPAPLGKSIFESRCVTCHGAKGDGKGLAAAYVSPRPRSFLEGKFKFRTTESGSIPTDADIERTVREGLHSTAMPDWKDFIGGDSLKAVVAYVKSFSPRFDHEAPKVFRMGAPIPPTPSSIESGKKVFARLQCASCHGVDGSGRDAVAKDLMDDWGFAIPTPVLAEPWTFRAGATASDIYLRVRSGIDGTPMPSFVGSASDRELWDLANYVVSFGRKPLWAMNGEEVKEHYAQVTRDAANNKVAHGQYLVKMRGCASCHSTYTSDGLLDDNMEFAGGSKWSLGPYGNVTSINLTSDKETGLGGWSDDEIKRAITNGIRKDGSRSIPFPMPWTSYANLTADDLNDIIAYLRTIPPIYNNIPPPEPRNIFSYLWAKFSMLILKEDFFSMTYPGNAGTKKEELR